MDGAVLVVAAKADESMAGAAEPVDIELRIHRVRSSAVMLDTELAALYGVTVKVLLQAVRRNQKRFPADFVFSLTGQELKRLRSQIVTSKVRKGRARPIGFTADVEGGESSARRKRRP